MSDRDHDRHSSRPPQSVREDRVPDPELPREITEDSLARPARNELKTLTKENAEVVARHLAAASAFIDDDPELAHAHALAASRRAGRIAIVRETVGITAYAIGDFALALRELRTYRRISGKDDQIALIVDSERGLGRPERALEEARAVDREALPTEAKVGLAIAMSGARLDLGQTEAALGELDIPELDPDRAFPWSPALFDARALVLAELGREEEAAQWQRRAEVAALALSDGLTDEVMVIEELTDDEDDALVDDVEVGVNDGPDVDDAVAAQAHDAHDSGEVPSGSDAAPSGAAAATDSRGAESDSHEASDSGEATGSDVTASAEASEPVGDSAGSDEER